MFVPPLPQLKFHPEESVAQPLVLVIEDDAEIAELVCDQLREEGYATAWSDVGEAGLSMAKRLVPQIVLLDVSLPDADGLAICSELADDSATCLIPVIVLSGLERTDLVKRARGAGARYFVRKPYDLGALLVLVEHAIRESNRWKYGPLPGLDDWVA